MASGCVLVIDDGAVPGRTVAETLAEAGIRVHVLPSAIGATRAVIHHNVDVVVAHLRSPEECGEQLVNMFRNNHKLSHVKVVFTGPGNASALERTAIASGAAASVPHDRIKLGLLPIVHSLLHGRPSSRASV